MRHNIGQSIACTENVLWKYFVNDKVSVGSKIDGFLILLKGSFLKKKDKKIFCCVKLTKIAKKKNKTNIEL